MRGTCSAGFKLVATGVREQICRRAYERIHSHTMMPFAHLAWSGAWAGLPPARWSVPAASSASAARHARRTLPPGAPHFTRASASLRTLRGLIAASLRAFEQVADDGRALQRSISRPA